MPDLESVSLVQFAAFIVCLVALVMGFNACSQAWDRVSGKRELPQPLLTQRTITFATEAELHRVEGRLEHVEAAQREILTKLDHDKTEIMAAAHDGRAHINASIADVAATCNQTAGIVRSMGHQLDHLLANAINPKPRG